MCEISKAFEVELSALCKGHFWVRQVARGELKEK